MPSREDATPPEGAGFVSTRWSVVAAAAAAGSRIEGSSRAALETLCASYWYPLYAYVRRQGHDPDEAADLTQAYFTRLLEKGDLKAADAARGRFRAFLIASLKHFLANERERRRARKRGGDRVILSLDGGDAERRYAHEPADDMTPERVFDRRFATALLQGVQDRLRQEQVQAGKGALFDLLEHHLTADSGRAPLAEVARALDMQEGAVRVALHRLRRRFAELLRQEVAGTLTDPGDVDDELRVLLGAWS